MTDSTAAQSFHYCRLGSAPALSFILLFGWLVVLLYMLGTTAEDHFCPGALAGAARAERGH